MTHSITKSTQRSDASTAKCCWAVGSCRLRPDVWRWPASAGSSSADRRSQQISRVIAKEMTAAQKALQAQQWAGGASRIWTRRRSKSGTHAVRQEDDSRLQGLRQCQAQQSQGWPQADYEKALATGALLRRGDGARPRARCSGMAAARISNTRRPSITASRWSDRRHGDARRPRHHGAALLPAEGLQELGRVGGQGVAAASKAGEAPKENLYLFKLQCASDAGDNAGDGRPVLIDLIKLTNKTTYWNTLLRIERQDERDDHNTLDDLPHHVRHQRDERRHRLHRDGAAPGRCRAARRGADRAREGHVDRHHQG